MADRIKPWDARLAAICVRPFRDSPIRPNHLTTLRLVVGIGSAYLFADGANANLAAIIMAASNFLDHCDGELARLSDKATRFGHYYDLACDAAVTVMLFVSMGLGLATTHDNSTAWLEDTGNSDPGDQTQPCRGIVVGCREPESHRHK